MASTRSLLGIIAALPAEARAAGARAAPVGQVIRLADNALLIRCGIGRARAKQAARDLVQAGAGSLLSWGSAAALSRHLVHGELVLPDTVLSRDGQRLDIDVEWRRRIAAFLEGHGGFHSGAVAEAEQILEDSDDKRQLRDRSGALIADMESAAVAEVCQGAGARMLVIRAVSDRVTAGIPACALAAVDSNGDLRLARCLGKLALAPGDLPALLMLARGFRHACAALSDLAARAGPDFLLPQGPPDRRAGDPDRQR